MTCNQFRECPHGLEDDYCDACLYDRQAFDALYDKTRLMELEHRYRHLEMARDVCSFLGRSSKRVLHEICVVLGIPYHG